MFTFPGINSKINIATTKALVLVQSLSNSESRRLYSAISDNLSEFPLRMFELGLKKMSSDFQTPTGLPCSAEQVVHYTRMSNSGGKKKPKLSPNTPPSALYLWGCCCTGGHLLLIRPEGMPFYNLHEEVCKLTGDLSDQSISPVEYNPQNFR